MKKTLTTLCLAALALPGFSQITLTQANYPLPPASVPIQDVSSQVTTNPVMGPNSVWNYSTLTAGTAATNPFPAVSSDPNFPTAQFLFHNLIKGLTPALGYYFDQYYNITASGAEVVGIHIPAQNYGLGALTGVMTDTLYVLDNVITYPANSRPIVKFPATLSSSWSSNPRNPVNMLLTVDSAHLNKTPLVQAFYYNRADTVVGWGTLKLPPVTGFNTNIPVLQETYVQFCVDSFYLGGSLAPAQLLNSFNITQGQQSGPFYNRMVLYRAGEFNYQMAFNYSDNTFSTVSAVYVNMDLPVATGINDITTDIASVAYPNPMNGRSFDVQTEANAQVAEISIEDISGRVVDHIAVINNASIVHVEATHTLSTGMYIYSLLSADGSIIAKGKISSAK
jgi:hypothetical protein